MHTITWTSRAFPVLPHEDEQLNPGIPGKSVATRITERLSGTRFKITEEIHEDFGYCLMVHRKPYCLWVGCARSSDHPYEEEGLDAALAAAFPLESIAWTVWVTSERGLLSRLLMRDDRSADKNELLALLRAELSALPHVNLLLISENRSIQ